MFNLEGNNQILSVPNSLGILAIQELLRWVARVWGDKQCHRLRSGQCLHLCGNRKGCAVPELDPQISTG